MDILKTAAAGSFKFKKEIDELHEEFADHGVKVLEPTKGWLFLPKHIVVPPTGFRPFPDERHYSSIKEVEDRFLTAIRKSHFLYLFNTEGYLGKSATFEVGYALMGEVPIFAKEPISLENVEYDIAKWEFLKDAIRVATPGRASQTIREQMD
jgi:hypothetical protein